ncbi:MAG TPA: HlyD family secretion protein [Bradyrhizobium sp.]|jgi:multidrug resistance efflux pump|nr:HlyD family secretion protein [Bradyrhizobium sp.]
MPAVLRVLLTLILCTVAGLLSYDLAGYYLYSPWTREARVRANVVTVAPDVSGYVDDIRVRNNQFVHKDDVLLVIDQDRYRIALANAEAAVAATHAQHLMLLDQYQRRSKLSPGVTITVENLDNARRQSETAAANYQQAIASRDTAALNLKRTEVRASVNGFITNLNLAKGTYASQGQPVMALIDSDSYRVEAYFEETKIPHIKPGATAEIYLMDGSPALQGTVLGIARGITDQDNPNGPQLLSSINPTFTWVRLAQRIPVGIHLTHVPPGVLISAGMTCTVVMKEGAAPEIGLGIKKVVASALRPKS